MKQAAISQRPTGATQRKLSRRKIFYVALHIKGNSGKTWSASLTHAWALYRLMRRMTHEVVTFTYRKKDGTIRTARGTLPPRDTSQGTPSGSHKVFHYYDLDARAYRSFRVENLIGPLLTSPQRGGTRDRK